MSKSAKSVTVLGIKRPGPDYDWFTLFLNATKSVDVADKKVIWEVKDGLPATTATIKKGYRTKIDKALEIKSVKITGSQDEIDCLMASVGISTPRQINDYSA
ncbi:MAG TPA: hypothetical protein DDY44_01445 [Candidatus Moranbacteria bacterium]|nr:hypothetical protein [Candidatus Moranbacteria bacterium]